MGQRDRNPFIFEPEPSLEPPLRELVFARMGHEFWLDNLGNPAGLPNDIMGRTYGCCDQHRVSLSLENIGDKNYLVHGSGVFGTGATARFGYRLVY